MQMSNDTVESVQRDKSLRPKQALLVVFGDIDFPRKVRADKVYEYLTSRNAWFVSRHPRGFEPAMPVLFYQSGIGFRGTAVVDAVGKTSQDDRKEYGLIPLDAYPTKIILRDLHTFASPVDPRPLLRHLSFVTNKVYWGHSFRTSPRLIPGSDYQLITRSKAALTH